MKNVLREVLLEITPDEKEEKELLDQINKFIKKINSCAGDAKAILGGSMAKGTWIKGVYDADIFVQFPYKEYKDRSTELSDILEKRIKKVFPKISRLHGSRDYFQIKQDNITYEIIPILNISKANQAVNITDISPLHAKWVARNIKNAGEIRLTKAFCRAQGVYGAESYIRGFSGYVVEILTIYYKTFARLAKEASKWKPKTIIDIKKHHKNVMLEVNKSKLTSPLILIDPVQKGRNTAASLSDENYAKFVAACKAFIEEPSKESFKKEEISKKILSEKNPGCTVIMIDVSCLEGKEDVIGGKLVKAHDFIITELTAYEYQVIKKGFDFDKESHARLWYCVKPKKLEKEQHWQGPPKRRIEHVEAFKRKYKNTYTKENRIYAIVKRKYTTPEKLVAEKIKEAYFKDKVMRAKIT